ncbi:MAG: winged helix-turn-helix domain-containing protein [Promethearchaeota archaeon]
MDEKLPNNLIINSIYSILKDTKRRQIINLLTDRDFSADELTKKLKITRPGVEKHLKRMLKIGLIERKAETVPNLHYIYSLPDYSQDLLSDLTDCLDTFIDALKDCYSTRLEEEEQLFLLGRSSKQKYEAIKKVHDEIMHKIKNK